MEFEPKIPVFDRAKTAHGLDSAATVTDIVNIYTLENYFLRIWYMKYINNY